MYLPETDRHQFRRDITQAELPDARSVNHDTVMERVSSSHRSGVTSLTRGLAQLCSLQVYIWQGKFLI